MFTYRHLGQSICPLRTSMGRGCVSPSIHLPITPEAFNYIWAVSRCVLLIHIIVLIVYY